MLRTGHEQKDILDKIHPHNTGNGAVVPGVFDVTPVIGQPPSYIMVHAPE